MEKRSGSNDIMSNKEVVVFLTMIREQLDKGNVEVVRTLLNEKIKRLGFKVTGELLSSKTEKQQK